MRLVFFGSPAFAVPSLEALIEAGHDVALVVSQPDRPTGRGQKTASPPVAQVAQERGLPLLQTSTLRGTEVDKQLRAVGAEGMALAAFAALVPKNVLEMAPHGILNVHPSLLPRWRGAAPIQSALRAGDAETGVTIIRLVRAMDAGPMLLQQPVAVGAEDDYLSLEPKLAGKGAEMLVEAFAQLAAGTATLTEQDDDLATYCGKIDRGDGAIDWSAPAVDVRRQVRAYRGWPQASTSWDGKLLKVLRATPVPVAGERAGTVARVGVDPVVACGVGALRLDEVLLQGKKPQSGAELLRGYASLVGSVLG